MKRLIIKNNIKEKIFTIRGVQVILDKDLAKLYDVETRILNQAVKRNSDRFPGWFRFQLTENEFTNLISQNVTSKRGGTRKLPFAFTEQGVSMLSALLKSKIAIEISIQIIDAFVSMRKFLANNAEVFQRLTKTERKLLEHEKNISELFKKFKTHEPKQGIFYDGQVFDAYNFVSSLIRKAKERIILIDNYIDDSVLVLFSKRKKGVSFIIYTNNLTNQLKLDVEKFNLEYGKVEIKRFDKSHDRFLIIDEDIYHFGASLKDLGKKWFAFSKFEKESLRLLEKLKSQ